MADVKINGYVNQTKINAENQANIKKLNSSLKALSQKMDQKMRQLKFYSSKNSGISNTDGRGIITSMNKTFTYTEDNTISVIFNFQKDHFACVLNIVMDASSANYKSINTALRSKKLNGKSLYPNCVSTAFNVDDTSQSFNNAYKNAERFVLEFMKVVEQAVKIYQNNKKKGVI